MESQNYARLGLMPLPEGKRLKSAVIRYGEAKQINS